MTLAKELDARYFKPLVGILSALYGLCLLYFIPLLQSNRFQLNVFLIGVMALFTSLLIFLADFKPFPNSVQKSKWVHSLNLALYLVTLIFASEELNFVFVWSFVLILIISFDPWLMNVKFRSLLPSIVVLGFGAYLTHRWMGPVEYSEAFLKEFRNDTYFIAFFTLLFLAIAAFFQGRRSYFKEIELRSSHHRFDAIFSSTEAGLVLYNSQGQSIYHNLKALEILGLSESEFKSTQTKEANWKAIHLDGRPMSQEEFPLSIALSTQKKIEGVVIGFQVGRHPRKWIRAQANPIRIGAEDSLHVVLSFVDVTEIIDSGEMTSGFYWHSSHGMGVLDLELKFVSLNRCLKEEFLVKEGALLYDFIITEDILYFQEGLEKARKKQVGQCYLRWIIGPNKVRNVDIHIYWSEASAQFFLQIHDVTELRSLYIKQKSIMDALDRTTIVTVNDLDGRIIEANKKFSQVTGYSLSEVLGKDHSFLKSGEHDDEFYSKMWLTLRKGFIWSGQVCNRNKDGSLYWTFSTLTPSFDDLGRPLGFIEVGQDITELKLAQAQAIQAGKMATLGEMASGVAHEINNPLAVISGRVTLLKKKVPGETENDTKIRTDLEKIEAQVHRITKIVNGLRSFARGSAADPKVPYSIKKIVEESVELVVERYLKSNVNLEVVPFIDATIECRHIEISQVIVNLLNNAFDAISELEEKWIKLEVRTTKSHLIISVTDSGSGIEHEILAKMMNPFFTTKEIGKGTGLGLSISKGIIEGHGGTLEYNKESANTQFVIKLPIYNQ